MGTVGNGGWERVGTGVGTGVGRGSEGARGRQRAPEGLREVAARLESAQQEQELCRWEAEQAQIQEAAEADIEAAAAAVAAEAAMMMGWPEMAAASRAGNDTCRSKEAASRVQATPPVRISACSVADNSPQSSVVDLAELNCSPPLDPGSPSYAPEPQLSLEESPALRSVPGRQVAAGATAAREDGRRAAEERFHDRFAGRPSKECVAHGLALNALFGGRSARL